MCSHSCQGKTRRNQIERTEPFGAAAITVDGESNALQQERGIRELAPFFKLRGAHRCELVEDSSVVRANRAFIGEHLVEESAME